MAIVPLRSDTEGRRYYDRKLAAGKTNMEAMRCLKRRLSDIVYTQMRDRRPTPQGRAREDTRGRHFNPAWPTHTPTSTLRISHFPDPPHPSLEPTSPPRLDTEGCQSR